MSIKSGGESIEMGAVVNSAFPTDTITVVADKVAKSLSDVLTGISPNLLSSCTDWILQGVKVQWDP